MSIDRNSRSGIRLALLLTGLALTNLGNIDEQLEPKCNCSTYAGLMSIEPGQLVLREGQTGILFATFPGGAQWSLGEVPDPDVISGVSTSGDFAFEVRLTAADRIDDPNAVFHGEGAEEFAVVPNSIDDQSTAVVIGPYRQVPARRTRLEITAEPNDPAFAAETRRVTVLVIVPWLHVRESAGDYLDPGDSSVPDLDWDSIAAVESFSDREWDFEFDVADAPSFRPPVSVERLTPNAVRVAVPYADTVNWRISGYNCLVEEPIHVTATDGDRVIRRTVIARILGALDKENPERSCPQPEDFRN